MGDSRASIEIKFAIYDKTFEVDMWINYYPDSGPDGLVDRRVAEWFDEKYREARAEWDAQLYEENRAAREREQRESDLRELERLKAKYEHATKTPPDVNAAHTDAHRLLGDAS